MGGFFGTISKSACITDLFYGTDYNSHLGTRRGGLATYDQEAGFTRSIHNLENSYFRTKFEASLSKFKGNAGIGIISDTDAQPIVINSHLGKFAIVTVAKINNIEELEQELLEANMHFSELSSGRTNQTELVALLITQGRDFVSGIENVYDRIKGSCSMLLLTEQGIIVARDKLGRTPIVIGKKENAYAATSESSSLPNLDYEIERYVGPGEILRLTADSIEQLRKPNEEMQICSFLWVYYGFPVSSYEGRNVEDVRFRCGYKMGGEERRKRGGLCLRHPRFGRRHGVRLCRRERGALSPGNRQIHADLAAQFHACQSGDAVAGGKNEADTEPCDARREAYPVLRRLDRARDAASRQCKDSV